MAANNALPEYSRDRVFLLHIGGELGYGGSVVCNQVKDECIPI
jgi:hypothetical protein